jgi:hypothetical protein
MCLDELLNLVPNLCERLPVTIVRTIFKPAVYTVAVVLTTVVLWSSLCSLTALIQTTQPDESSRAHGRRAATPLLVGQPRILSRKRGRRAP